MKQEETDPDNMDLARAAIARSAKSQFILNDMNSLQAVAIIGTILVDFVAIDRMHPEDFEVFLSVLAKTYTKMVGEARNSKTQL